MCEYGFFAFRPKDGTKIYDAYTCRDSLELFCQMPDSGCGFHCFSAGRGTDAMGNSVQECDATAA